MTYVLLMLPFIAVSAVVCALGFRALPAPRRRRHGIVLLIALVVLLVTTLIFDNLMILAGLFEYGREGVLGIWLWLMPIEDFSYPLVAVLLLPGLWILFDSRDGARS